MRVVSVNIASFIEDASQIFGSKVKTGIYKRPQSGRVKVDFSGLEGDVICNSKHHGVRIRQFTHTVSKIMCFGDNSLNYLPKPGAFGDNLTLSGLDLSSLCIGDILILPDLQLQVTAPRIPCRTLSSALKRKDFAQEFIKANRPGAYLRVIQEGTVGESDDVKLKSFENGERVKLTKFFMDMRENLTKRELEKYLRLPIDRRSRKRVLNSN